MSQRFSPPLSHRAARRGKVRMITLPTTIPQRQRHRVARQAAARCGAGVAPGLGGGEPAKHRRCRCRNDPVSRLAGQRQKHVLGRLPFGVAPPTLPDWFASIALSPRWQSVGERGISRQQGKIVRRLARSRPQLWVRASGEEQFRGRIVSVHARKHEARRASGIAGVDSRAPAQQSTDELGIAIERCKHQRSIAAGRGPIKARARRDQHQRSLTRLAEPSRIAISRAVRTCRSVRAVSAPARINDSTTAACPAAAARINSVAPWGSAALGRRRLSAPLPGT